MPTYDYRCTVCGHRFELVQKMSEPPRKRCPKCGKKVERLIGAGAGLLFKGSGFYITDYRSPEYQAKAKAESSHGAKPAADPVPASGPSPSSSSSSGSSSSSKSPKPGSPGAKEGGA